MKYWGNWVLEEARKELERFYPKDKDGSIPVGYIWARTLPCQNPECGADIPLMRQFWLAKKGSSEFGTGSSGKSKRIALWPVADTKRRRIDFAIVHQVRSKWEILESPGGRISELGIRNSARSAPNSEFRTPDSGFDPEQGTVSRAHVRCPVCGNTMDDGTTRKLFRGGKSGQRMVAVVLHHPERTGKTYRLPTDRHLETYRAAENALVGARRRLAQEWGMDPVPDEPLPIGGRDRYDTCRLPLYGSTCWSDLFNSRQKLGLITFLETNLKASSLQTLPIATRRRNGSTVRWVRSTPASGWPPGWRRPFSFIHSVGQPKSAAQEWDAFGWSSCGARFPRQLWATPCDGLKRTCGICTQRADSTASGAKRTSIRSSLRRRRPSGKISLPRKFAHGNFSGLPG